MTSTVRMRCRASPRMHVADQRRLAVAAGRDEEHFLPLGEVLAEPVPLLLAVGERAGRDDLAVDERVVLSLRRLP